MRTFPAIPQSVHAARRFANDTLADTPEQALEAVELMVSELATNCIRHERTSPHVAIVRSPRRIRVEVTDSGGGVPTMRSPGPDEPSGRGLQIVDMLSEQWGIEPEAPSGKTVWFTMDVPSSRPTAHELSASGHRSVEEPAPITGRPTSVQARRDPTTDPIAQHATSNARRREPDRARGTVAGPQGCLRAGR